MPLSAVLIVAFDVTVTILKSDDRVRLRTMSMPVTPDISPVASTMLTSKCRAGGRACAADSS
jgi:hypothetical protein